MDGIHLGPILIRWNGILVMLGAVAGCLVAAREAKRRGQDPEIILELFFPILMWGLIGARLWHVLTPPLSSVELGLTTEHYFSNPLDFAAVWIGGFGFPGALICGTVALFFTAKKYEMDFREWVDIFAPAIALGQSIGRLGNFFNQELYGLPVPWGLFIDPAHRLPGFESVERYHPLFAYDAVLNLGNFFFLLWLSRKYPEKLRPGGVFLAYLFTSSIIRFVLEFLRLDVSLVFNWNINQLVMAGIALISGWVLYRRMRFAQEL